MKLYRLIIYSILFTIFLIIGCGSADKAGDLNSSPTKASDKFDENYYLEMTLNGNNVKLYARFSIEEIPINGIDTEYYGNAFADYAVDASTSESIIESYSCSFSLNNDNTVPYQNEESLDLVFPKNLEPGAIFSGPRVFL